MNQGNDTVTTNRRAASTGAPPYAAGDGAVVLPTTPAARRAAADDDVGVTARAGSWTPSFTFPETDTLIFQWKSTVS